jgi:hypothetical protein
MKTEQHTLLNKSGNKLINSKIQMKWESIFQDLWDTGKIILRGKFATMSAYVRKLEKSQINSLVMHLKLLKKQSQANPKSNREK